jgi:hypothetical protein
MPRVIEDSHFIPSERVPTGPLELPMRAAYALLSEWQTSGLILLSASEPVAYATAAFLKAAIQIDASENGAALASSMPVQFALARFLGRDANFHPKMLGILGAEIAIVPVLGPINPYAEAPARRGSDYTVYPVRDPKRLVGWYFSHETLAQGTVQQSPPSYLCKDNNHPNADSDSGWCRFCPSALIL